MHEGRGARLNSHHRGGDGRSRLAHVPGSIATGAHANITITITITVVVGVVVIIVVIIAIVVTKFVHYTAALQARGLVGVVGSFSR